MQVKKQQLGHYMEQRTGSKLGKEYVKAVYCHPAYFISMQNTSCEMLGWMKHKLASRVPGELSIILDMQGLDINNLSPTAESEKELKSLLMKVKGESEKTVLKLNIIKIKVMTNRRGKSGSSDRFYFLGL